jgi:hypothetical protein
MKRIAAVLSLLLSLAGVSSAQNWSLVTATNLTYQDGTKLPSGKLCFTGTDSDDNPVSFKVGGGGQAVSGAVCTAITDGAIGSFSVPNPAVTAPANINYRVEVNDNQGWKLVYTQVHFTGSPFNFDAYVPNVGTVTSGTSVDDLTVGTLHVTACVGSGCGSGSGTSASFVDNETPSGTINGVNTNFSIAQAPVPTASLVLTRNGIVLFQSVDYTLSGTAITFLSGAIPVTGDALRASYRIGGSSSNFVDFETPTGTINGVNLSFTLAHSPVTGSLALMRNGVVLVATVDYALSGSSITFTSGAQPLTGDSLFANYRY